MVFKEDLADLYFAFNDRLAEDGKEEKIIKCKICCLELPAYSTRAEVCEMCFDTDFWDFQKEEAKKRTDTMWAVKSIKSGIMGNCYHPKNSYWAGNGEDSSARLSGARLCQTRDEAKKLLDMIEESNLASEDKELPEFKMVQIQLTEI